MPTKQMTKPAGAAAAFSGSGTKTTKGKSVLPESIELPDGTKIPVRIPPGMSPQEAAGVIAYLQANPEAARAAHEQAMSMLKQSPGIVGAMTNLMQQPTEGAQEMFEVLKDDEELQAVFEDVKANGPSALQKYWDDTELMSKISQKLRAMRLQKAGQEEGGEGGAAGAAAASSDPDLPPSVRKAGPPQPPLAIASLHEAAKWGDAAAAKKLLDGGEDPNAKNERGVCALGVAVGFNRHAVVQVLLDGGADVVAVDGQGNTPLHYAAGYGRREILEQLLGAGADLEAVNSKKQKPIDVARLNGEKAIVKYLNSKTAEP